MQFGTHDVVVLKPNKADLGSPALGQGVVYRLKVDNFQLKNDYAFHYGHALYLLRRIAILQDSSITIAFDDVPEEGLNSPLRIEKLANEVECS